MAAPVTNQNYTQQINQAFNFLKNATPQQMQTVGQQVKHNPQSPEAMALAMASQYQQQLRSSQQPPAPQGTILQQKLAEFQQTAGPAQGGLPAVGQNQMAMQQAAQQDPMHTAGIAAAPENTEQAPAPAPQPAPQAPQMSTGGITALAHGGAVRRFNGEDGSYTGQDPLADEEAAAVDEEAAASDNMSAAEDTSTAPNWYEKFARSGKPSAGLPSALPASVNLGGDPSSPTGKYEAPQLDMPISDMGVPTTGGTSPKVGPRLSDMTTPKVKPKVKPHHNKRDNAPAPGSSAEANAASPTAKGETYKTPEVTTPAAQATSPEDAIANIMKLRGSSPDMSEEVAAAKESAANASRDKGLGALVGGIGGMLSAQTPYMSQALGSGLMSGLSSYQQGAKEEGVADKELLALQLAHKKSLNEDRRGATDMYLGQQAEQSKAAAAANATAAGLRFGLQGDLIKGKQRAGFEQEQQAAKQRHDIDMATQAQIDKLDLIGATGDMKLRVAKLSPAVRQQLLTTVYNRANKEGMDSTELQTLLDEAEKFTYQNKSQPKGMGQSLAPLGSSGVFYSPKK